MNEFMNTASQLSFLDEFREESMNGLCIMPNHKHNDYCYNQDYGTPTNPLLYPTPPRKCFNRFFLIQMTDTVRLMRRLHLLEHGIKRIYASIFGCYTLLLLLLPLLKTQFLLTCFITVNGTLFLTYFTAQRIYIGCDCFCYMFCRSL